MTLLCSSGFRKTAKMSVAMEFRLTVLSVQATRLYIPLIAFAIIGLILRKRWSLLTTAAVMAVSAYRATTIVFMLVFLDGAPGYYLEPGLEYWLVMAAYIVFGVWGLLYLVFRGDNLIT
jgi:hypothetical protein